MDPRIGVLRHTVFKPSERFIPDQVRATPGIDVRIVTRDRVVDPVPGLRVVRMPLRGRVATARYVATAWPAPLRSVIRSERIDLVHAHFGVEGAYSRRAAASAGVAHVVTLHGFDVSYSTRALLAARTTSWVLWAAARRRLLATDSLFVCVSEHVRRLALALGAREDRTPVLPTGVDTALLQPSPLPDTPTVVHVARLTEKKGTADLVSAVASARAAVPDLRLDVYGDGPLRPELEAQASALGVAGAVRFRGVQPHDVVLEAIRAASIVAVPSVTAASGDTEGLPQVVLEAGALGRPVVATRHAGIPEAVVDGATGLLVDEHDVAALGDSMAGLLQDHAAASRLGAAAAKRISRDFDVHRQGERLRGLYAGELAG